MRLLPLLVLLALPPSARSDESNDKKSALCPLGDLNGDGIPDLAVASRDIPEHDAPPGHTVSRIPTLRIPERVALISGRDGSLLRLVQGTCDGDGFGSALANVGDLDGDGVDDLIIGAVPRPVLHGHAKTISRVHVISGASGVTLFVIPAAHPREALGYSVSGLGDLDGDGIPEFAASSPWSRPRRSAPHDVQDFGPGFVEVYSGRDASRLHRIEGQRTGTVAGELFGACVSSVGDLDGDGRAEVAVSAPGRWIRWPRVHAWNRRTSGWETQPCMAYLSWVNEYGVVCLYSGATFAEIAQIERTAPNGVFGWTLATCEDVDLDGKPDFLLGTLHRSVDLVSGATLTVIRRWTDHGGTFSDPYGFASSVHAVGDIDEDGCTDVVIGANEEYWAIDPGHVDLVSGRTGGRIWRYFDLAKSPAARFAWPAREPEPAEEGYDACGCGDVNEDGIPDVAIVTQLSRRLRFVSGRDAKLLREVRLRDLLE